MAVLFTRVHRALRLRQCRSSFAIDRFHLATWAELGAILTGDGPAGLIRRVRAAAAADPKGERWPRSKIHDDATAVLWEMATGPEAADSQF